jgi:hypothetical protein
MNSDLKDVGKGLKHNKKNIDITQNMIIKETNIKRQPETPCIAKKGYLLVG